MLILPECLTLRVSVNQATLSAPETAGTSPRGIGLRTKLLIGFGALFAATLLTVLLAQRYGIPLTPFGGDYQKRYTNACLQLSVIADIKKQHLSQWFEERRDDARLMAESRLVQESLSRILAHYPFRAGANPAGFPRAELERDPAFRNLCEDLAQAAGDGTRYTAVDILEPAEGVILASSRLSEVGARSARPNLATNAFPARGTAVIELLPGPQEGSWMMVISRAISISSQPMAILRLRINPERTFQRILNTGAGLEQTGEAVMVNQDGRLLTALRHPLPAGEVAKPWQYINKAEPARLAAMGEEGVKAARDYRGVPVLAAYRHLQLGPGVSVGLVVKQDQAEVFAGLRESRMYVLWLGGAGLLLTLALTFAVANLLTRPLRQMAATAQAVAAGDFKARVPLPPQGELAALARTFNRMIERIQEGREHLEALVEQRTAELHRANEALKEEVNEHERAAEGLRASKLLFENLAQVSPVGIFRADLDSRFIYVNRRWLELSGLTAEQAMGSGWVSALHPDDRERVLREWRETLPQKQLLVHEFRFQRPDGAVVWLLGQAIAESNQDGAPVGYVGTVTDITQHKETLERLSQLSRAVEQSPCSIVITDPTGVIQYVNPRFTALTGYQPEEVLGRNPRLLKSGEQSAEYYANLWRTILSGEDWRGEFQNRKKNGELYWESASISPLRNAAGKITHFVAVKEDITRHKLADEEQRRLISDLQAALAKVKMLTGLLPICAGCKKIRDDQGYWHQVEIYISEHSDADFTHGLCPECARNLYPEIFKP